MNWEFFRQQWEDHELGTRLQHWSAPVRLATLRAVMGKNCLQIFLNSKLTPEERASVSSSSNLNMITGHTDVNSSGDKCY